MFSGIVETIGVVEQIAKVKDNIELKIRSQISCELTVDQSVSHNGVCLTVTRVSSFKPVKHLRSSFTAYAFVN